MTAATLPEAPAGPGLDERVAVLVMGHVVEPTLMRGIDLLERWDDGATALRPYSTDIAAAWLVIEQVCAWGWYPLVARDQSVWTAHVARYGPPGNRAVTAHADTAPLAICRLAVKLVAAYGGRTDGPA